MLKEKLCKRKNFLRSRRTVWKIIIENVNYKVQLNSILNKLWYIINSFEKDKEKVFIEKISEKWNKFVWKKSSNVWVFHDGSWVGMCSTQLLRFISCVLLHDVIGVKTVVNSERKESRVSATIFVSIMIMDQEDINFRWNYIEQF